RARDGCASPCAPRAEGPVARSGRRLWRCRHRAPPPSRHGAEIAASSSLRGRDSCVRSALRRLSLSCVLAGFGALLSETHGDAIDKTQIDRADVLVENARIALQTNEDAHRRAGIDLGEFNLDAIGHDE